MQLVFKDALQMSRSLTLLTFNPSQSPEVTA